jgi:hypothetical protein
MPAATHGKTRTPIYNTWRGMVGRCNNPSDIYYHNYGGRGIAVCNEWQDASTFIAWALANGWEEGLQIDRIDNDGNYEPGNCRFVTRSENCRNMRSNRLLTFRGATKPISVWAEQLSIPEGTIRSRTRRGWTPEQALTLCPQRGKKP